MKIGWGVKITLLYVGFVLLIGTMVVASTHQHFDLVSDTYYSDEIKYQNVIDAGKNQAALSQPINVHANEQAVSITLPAELQGKKLAGNIHFYSPVHATWDKEVPVTAASNDIEVPRAGLQKTHYTVKIELEADGKKYYQESGLDLSK